MLRTTCLTTHLAPPLYHEPWAWSHEPWARQHPPLQTIFEDMIIRRAKIYLKNISNPSRPLCCLFPDRDPKCRLNTFKHSFIQSNSSIGKQEQSNRCGLTSTICWLQSCQYALGFVFHIIFLRQCCVLSKFCHETNKVILESWMWFLTSEDNAVLNRTEKLPPRSSN